MGRVAENHANLFEVGDRGDQLAVAINDSADGRQEDTPMN